MIVDFEEEGPKMGYKNRSQKPSRYNKNDKNSNKKFLNKKRANFRDNN